MIVELLAMVIPNRIGIKQRPSIAAEKTQIGHWEGDTIIGGNHLGAIATHVDKASKFLVARVMKTRTSAEMNRVSIAAFTGMSADKRRTFTFDTGVWTNAVGRRQSVAAPTAVRSMKIPIVIDPMIFEQLNQFRQSLYSQLGKAKDAVFELMDAVLTSASTVSFVSLCQSPVFRRQWPSIYAALHDSRLPQAKLLKQMVGKVDTAEQPILAGDRTFWPRRDAQTLKERVFDHDSQQKRAVGQSYSTLAWIAEDGGSWALPLRHERISSFETPSKRAAFQLQQVSRQLGRRPLALYDRGYGNARFVNQTAAIEADLLLRLAANRCVFGAPPAYGGRGAPRKHGVKFKFKDPTTWPEDSEAIEVDDPQYGRVQLTRWSNFHFKQSPKRGMEILRVEVLEAVGRKRKFQVLWLAWLGQVMPPLQVLWRSYLRRFALEHWYRFAKQRLYWTLPQLSSNQALERWSLLVVLMSWQLWLARHECMDSPLPWQAPQDKLAPGRIAQGFASILAAIGTPANAPKARGKSPGRATGHCPSARPHYPTVKKRARKRKQAEKVPRTTTKPAA